MKYLSSKNFLDSTFNSQEFSNGVYYVKIGVGEEIVSMKIVVMK